jgi:hypothetical protein
MHAAGLGEHLASLGAASNVQHQMTHSWSLTPMAPGPLLFTDPITNVSWKWKVRCLALALGRHAGYGDLDDGNFTLSAGLGEFENNDPG